MAKKAAKQVVEEEMPGMEIVKNPPVVPQDLLRHDLRPGASIADLRKKYLGPDALDDEEAHGVLAASASNAEEDEVEVVKVRPKHTPADPADDPGVRTVIVSKKGGILGCQG